MIRSVKRYRRISVAILLVAIIALVVYALVMAWKTPRHMIENINQRFADTSAMKTGSDQLLAHEDVFALKKEEAFLRSRLKMAENDSICMTLDMRDSLLMLELQGVVIHQARIQEIRVSNVFPKINRSAFIQLFNRPFRVDSCRTTIIKEPIVVKKAPADTIEASKQAPIRDTVPPPPATYHLYLNRDVVLMVYQTQIIDEQNEIYRTFVRQTLHRRVNQLIHGLFRFKIPEYTPWIMIFVTQDDAITTYRAIPYHSQVTIRI